MKQVMEYQAASTEGIRLNANESSLNLSEEIRSEIASAVMGIEYNRYPDDEETELLNAYAEVSGMKAEELLAGNGSDQMLGLLIGHYLGKGKTLLTLDPDFSMYDYYASAYEADVKKYDTNDDGSFDMEDFIEYAKDLKPDMILFSNPNNPTGWLVSQEELEQLAKAFCKIPVIADEAYIEFAGVPSCAPLVRTYENFFVTRTLSKAYSMAGVRVGFLIGNVKQMRILKASKVPYALSAVSMVIAKVVLKHSAEFQTAASGTIQRREAMLEKLASMERAEFYPSNTNFIFGRSDDKQELLDLFEEAGITIRNYDNDSFRITIGTEAENKAVLKVLQEFEQEG